MSVVNSIKNRKKSKDKDETIFQKDNGNSGKLLIYKYIMFVEHLRLM